MESAIPPSYEEATTRDYWALIAQYIASADLCAASLVSTRWHKIFARCLWGNPASHFGTENDRVYGAAPHASATSANPPPVALTRFKRTLPRARLRVRRLTHTLHLPPALSEIYDGPHPEWLRDVLEQLPNLQALVVSQLPFFDHSSLLALRHYSSQRTASEDFPTFPLRLLIATQCANTTSAGLAEAFLHWPNLVFLDLSHTLAARDTAVLSALRFMVSLQVLKLRHTQFRDEDMEVLAGAIGRRVRSLDIRDNRMTDESVRTLLSTCFDPVGDVQATQNAAGNGLRLAEEDWLPGIQRPDVHVLSEFRGYDLDERLVKRLTRGVESRLPSEDLPPTGITHLYIANNFVTVEAIASLIKSQNLHVLDAGAVDTAKVLGMPRRAGTRSSLSYPSDHSVSLPGAEKLTPMLERYASKNLTHLRVHHAVVTETAAISKDDTPTPVELESVDAGRFEIDGQQLAGFEVDGQDTARHELDATVPVYELAEGQSTPRFELPGDPMHIVVSPSIGKPPAPTPEEQHFSEVRRGAAFAPEVIVEQNVYVYDDGDGDDDHDPIILSATGLGGIAQAVNGIPSPYQEEFDESALQSPPPMRPLPATFPFTPPPGQGLVTPTQSSEMTIAMIEERRRAIRARSPDQLRGLLPGALPALRTLVLTDVPLNDNEQMMATARLQRFLEDCSEEAHLAALQASIEYPLLYVPGKPRSSHQQHRSRELFALRQIVLEMASPSSAAASMMEGPRSPVSPHASTWRSKRNSSSTGDRDTEMFWSAQENDFSFFGAEECGLPASEPGMHFPLSALAEKMVLPADGPPAGALPTLQQATAGRPDRDVVAALARFRRERKARWERERNRELGGRKTFVHGHWPGEVKVVRRKAGERKGEGQSEVDFYGNYLERGVYR
jgi:hypothetical protein